jgi:hypothetical protein
MRLMVRSSDGSLYRRSTPRGSDSHFIIKLIGSSMCCMVHSDSRLPIDLDLDLDLDDA